MLVQFAANRNIDASILKQNGYLKIMYKTWLNNQRFHGLHDLTPIGHNVLVYVILHAYNFSFLKHFTRCKNSIFRNRHEAHFMQKKKKKHYTYIRIVGVHCFVGGGGELVVKSNKYYVYI